MKAEAVVQEDANPRTVSLRFVRERRLPLRIPLFKDPRIMTRKELVSELRSRNFNCKGRHQVLAARLLKAVIDEGKTVDFDPKYMDDRQPEKWLRVANQAFRRACKVEPDPKSRVECMTRSNDWITKNVCDRTQLMQVAAGLGLPTDECELFQLLLQFGASLMIQPEVEQEAAATGRVGSSALRGSALIFQVCTGFAELPSHLTEACAGDAQRANDQCAGKRKRNVD